MTEFTLEDSFAQEDQDTIKNIDDASRDLAIVAINWDNADGIGTGTVYIFDENYSLIKILDSPEKPQSGQFHGDITYADDILILSTSSRTNIDHDSLQPGPAPQEGAVSLFDGTTGSFIKTIRNPEPNTRDGNVEGRFGSSVVYAENKIIIGNSARDVNGIQGAGTVYVFDKTTGELLSKIDNPNPTRHADFGLSLAALDENTVAVGIPGKTVDRHEHAGAVLVFDVNSGSMIKTIKAPDPGPRDKFGHSIDVMKDKLVVGAPGTVIDDEVQVGQVYVYDTKTWEVLHAIEHPDPDNNALFGMPVMFAGDNKIVISAIGDGTFKQGAVHIFDAESGRHLETINSPQRIKEGFYTNEFGTSLSVAGDRLAIGDSRKRLGDTRESIRTGGAYIYDITTGELLHTIENPVSDSSDAFGYHLGFVGDMKPSSIKDEFDNPFDEKNDTVSDIQKSEDSNSKEPDAGSEIWVKPQRTTLSIFPGTLEFDKVPDDFACDVKSKISYTYDVESTTPVIYPQHDSLVVRIGGEDTENDFEMMIGLQYDNSDDNNLANFAKDLSYSFTLTEKENYTGSGGGLASPDAYSNYSTLGVVVEANSSVRDDRILESEKSRITGLFPSDYVTPIGISSDGDYILDVKMFDSEEYDWIDSDRCGIQAVIPITVSGTDNVEVGQIQFSNIKVSAIETNHENQKSMQQVLDDLEKPREIKWINELGADYTVGGFGMIEMIHPGLNMNLQLMDIPVVHVWSDTDPQGIQVESIETGANTGVFYADVDFTDEESSHLSLQVSNGDIVTVSFVEDLSLSDDYDSNKQITDSIKIIHKYLPPLKQMEQEIPVDEITCMDDDRHKLFIKDGAKPLCLKQETYDMLVARGYF